MNKAFNSIKQGLEEALEYAQGGDVGAKVHHLPMPDVKSIRDKTGMSQHQFATTLGVSLKTLKYWEKGDRIPKGPGLVLLKFIDKAPRTVLEILSP